MLLVLTLVGLLLVLLVLVLLLVCSSLGTRLGPLEALLAHSCVSCHISSSGPKQSKALGHKNLSLQAA